MEISPCPQEAHGVVGRKLSQRKERCVQDASALQGRNLSPAVREVFRGLGASVACNSWGRKRRGHSRQRKLLRPRETKEHASLGTRAPEAAAVSTSVGQGRCRRDEGRWWVAKIWIMECLACLIKASGHHFESSGESVNGLKAADDIRINCPSCFPTATGLTLYHTTCFNMSLATVVCMLPPLHPTCQVSLVNVL